jgi:hypothetical protein
MREGADRQQALAEEKAKSTFAYPQPRSPASFRESTFGRKGPFNYCLDAGCEHKKLIMLDLRGFVSLSLATWPTFFAAIEGARQEQLSNVSAAPSHR